MPYNDFFFIEFLSKTATKVRNNAVLAKKSAVKSSFYTILLGKINVNGPPFRVCFHFRSLHTVFQQQRGTLYVGLIPEVCIYVGLQCLCAAFDEERLNRRDEALPSR